jgi:hypothetical protein
VPAATLILTMSIGSAAFAATGSSSTDTSASNSSTAVTATAAASSATAPSGATTTNPWGNQRSDETLLTGTALEQVKAVALAKIGSDATIVRVETDSDASLTGHAAYEAHIVKADGTTVTVYVDKSFNYVSTETQPTGGHAGGPSGGPATGQTGASNSTAPSSSSTANSTSTSSN